MSFIVIMITKKDLLHNLKNQTYCRISISKVAGVGVIAIRDIPKDTNPFIHSKNNICGANSKSYNITKTELAKLPLETQKLIKDFFAKEEDGSYEVVREGLNSLNITSYLNHSKTPNIDVVEVKNCNYTIFKALKKIKKGEELFINYGDFY